MKPFVVVLEICSVGVTNEDHLSYKVDVTCNNCGAAWYATIKKNVLVADHPCYNCGKKMLRPTISN